MEGFERRILSKILIISKALLLLDLKRVYDVMRK
jgi:hypothetical protein